MADTSSFMGQDIPADIVCEIFSYFATAFEPTYNRDFPWYLGHICSEWRVIFLSMDPQFWHSIILNFYQPVPESREVERITSMLKFFLERNSGKPFDLEYHCVISDSDLEYIKIKHIFEMLTHESMRWSKVSLTLYPDEIPMLYRVKDRLPLMWALIFNGCLGGSCSSILLETLVNDAFMDAPSLTHLELNLRQWGWNFNWPLLVYLRLWSRMPRPLHLLLDILSKALNLKTLIIEEVTDDNFGIEGSVNAITFPHLEYLKVFEKRAWLKYIRAPALQELCLKHVHGSLGSGLSEALVSFLCRSQCKLVRLTLVGSSTRGTYLQPIHMEFLRYTPELVHLALHWLSVENTIAVLASLKTPIYGSSSRETEYHAHRLQSLEVGLQHIDHRIYTNDTFEELSSLVRIRNGQGVGTADRPVGRLHSLSIEMPSGIELPPMGDRLRALCEELGVQSQFRYVELD